jgi:urease
MSYLLFRRSCTKFKSKAHSATGTWVSLFFSRRYLDFPRSVFLVTVHDPISSEDGDIAAALFGSFLPLPSNDLFPVQDPSLYAREKLPGAIIALEEDIVINKGRERVRLRVTNTGDRPVQVSQYFL